MPTDATGALHLHVPRATAAAAPLPVALRASARHLQPGSGLVPLAHGALAALRAAAEASGRVRARCARTQHVAGAAKGVTRFCLTSIGVLTGVRCILIWTTQGARRLGALLPCAGCGSGSLNVAGPWLASQAAQPGSPGREVVFTG